MYYYIAEAAADVHSCYVAGPKCTKIVIPCDGINDCLNTNIDEMHCKNVGKTVSNVCDGVCQFNSSLPHPCYDERMCNGYQYGMWCDNGTRYVGAEEICDGKIDCSLDGGDENNCTMSEKVPSCFREDRTLMPLFNNTRCSVRLEKVVMSSFVRLRGAICADYLDQTNCTDPERVALYCPVHGFFSSVAKQMVCMSGAQHLFYIPPITPQICDDGLDKACIQASLSCYVHKHLLCDGEIDCSDESDEMQCGLMTESVCKRRYTFEKKGEIIPFPMAWIADGETDCWDGDDENEWPSCGAGFAFRYVRHNHACQEVFLCYREERFVPLASLCDRAGTICNEDELCSVSRGLVTTYSKAHIDSSDRYRLSSCLNGLHNLQFLMGLSCIQRELTAPAVKIFGRNHSLKILLPDAYVDCKHVYGEYYVFMSCLDRCIDETCPLITPIRFNSCPKRGQIQGRLFTSDSTGRITFLIRDAKRKLLGNAMFVCKNGNCLNYDKVCDLADDCGDRSDEELCRNHFRCKNSGNYLPITQKCDHTIHCSDHSDECNESCGQKIINSTFLQIMAWIIGILSVILNCNAFAQSVRTMPQRKSEAALLNNFLVMMISVGDLLVGVYLTAVASFDAKFGQEYCVNQLGWLTSQWCVALGICSTFGSLVSLFFMTALSLMRVIGIQNEFSIPKEKNRGTIMKIIAITFLILIPSACISFLPLIEWLEDFFLNGIKYDRSNTLFVGIPNKENHIRIIKKYYGRAVVDSDLKWSHILGMVDSMFSEDYGGIEKKRLTFYGNDGVCLFKYFVNEHDPQDKFVFAVLLINLICFLVIAISYCTIATISRNSTKELTRNDGAENNRRNDDTKLQRVTQAIIFTDFICWVPFMITATLHVFGICDASSLYSIFSIIFLPINSVINPLLYDSNMRNLIFKFFKVTRITICVEVMRGLLEQLRTNMSKLMRRTKKIECGEDTVMENEIALELTNLTPRETS